MNRRKKNWNQFDENGYLICHICNKYKSVEYFHNCPSEKNRNGRNRRCKECTNTYYKEKYLKKIEEDSFKVCIDSIYMACKCRAKKSNMFFDISKDYLKYLIEKQNWKCAISGIKMTHYRNNKRCYTNLSVDRIDSNKGYTKDNIQIVCWIVNMMKSDMNMKYFLYICDNIIKNNSYGK